MNYAVSIKGYIVDFQSRIVSAYARIQVSTTCFKMESLNSDHIIKYIRMSGIILKKLIFSYAILRNFTAWCSHIMFAAS
jgi:hypothetical protein